MKEIPIGLSEQLAMEGKEQRASKDNWDFYYVSSQDNGDSMLTTPL